ncbi:MAG: hypothetical protein WBA43_19100 [Elainellaceae cyanobacterium]
MKSINKCCSEQEEIFTIIFGSLSDETTTYFGFSKDNFEGFFLEYIENDWLNYLAGNRHANLCKGLDRVNQQLSKDIEYTDDELYSLLRQHELFERYHHKYTGESDETQQEAYINFIKRLTDNWAKLAASEEDKDWALRPVIAMIDNRKYMLQSTQRGVEEAERFLASRKSL